VADFKFRNVLLVYKKSAYDIHFGKYRHPSLARLYRAGDPQLAHFERSHYVHYGTLETVRALLKKKKMVVRAVSRGEVPSARGFDLVLSVGGDGTFLEAARRTGGEPILGVNSDPAHSVGRFCTADRRSFPELLERVLVGRARIRRLARLAMKLNGRPLGAPVLNDVLVCHMNPAAMSHYVISVRGRREQHRGSGIWIATAAGSTGASHSAGGRPLPLESNRFLYWPRELYRGHRLAYRLKGGVLPSAGHLTLRSLMPEGMIYPDGAHARHAFGYGDILEVGCSKVPLSVLS
jgi:NAD+ kinase